MLERWLNPLLGRFGYRLVNERRRPPRPWEHDAALGALLPIVRPRTLLSPDRLSFIYQLARLARGVEGDVAEVGVYRGGSAYLIASALRGTGKTVHLFDTFAGMPAVDAQRDNAAFVQRGIFADTSEADVRAFLGAFGDVRTYAGLFPETAAPIAGRRFAMAYIDVDIYESTVACLEFFYPRMSGGGVMLFDDYKSPKCPGVAEAIDAFFADKREHVVHTTVHQAMVIRAAGAGAHEVTRAA